MMIKVEIKEHFTVSVSLTHANMHRQTHQLMTQLPVFLPSAQSLMISKPQPTSHSRPVFIVMLRLRRITKTTICSRTRTKDFTIKACDSEYFLCVFLIQKQREGDTSLSPSLLRIGLLLKPIVTQTGRAEWKTDSLQSSPDVFCLRSAPL